LACWQLQIPLSAAAVLALSVVVVREYRPGTAVIPAAHPEAAVKIAATPGTVTVREVPSALTSVGVIAPAAIVASPPSLQETGISVALVVESSEAVTDTNAPAEQALAIVETDAIIPFVPEENHSLAGVGELPAVEFELVSASDTELGFASGLEIQGEGFSVPWAQNRPEVRSSPTVPVTPREIRRGRILATLVVADNSSYKQQLNPGYAHEVIADTLADENSYTGISRIGMGGDRLTLKF
jgi:hypothetical protein